MYPDEGEVYLGMLDHSYSDYYTLVKLVSVVFGMHTPYRGKIAFVNVTSEYMRMWNKKLILPTNDIAVVTLSETIPDSYFREDLLRFARLPTATDTLNNNLLIAGYGDGK